LLNHFVVAKIVIIINNKVYL